LSVVDQRVHSFTSKKMASFFELLFSVIMIFAPVVGYIPQYFKIKQTRRSEGFSIFVSLVLLLANIVRLFFWIGKRFELTLMWQSVVMIVAQLMLLDICIRTRKLNEIHKRKHITAWAISTFWNWEDFSDYLLFLGGFTLAVGFLSLLFISQRWFVELLGSLALGIEAFLGVPQAYNNWKNQSTAGLSVALIVSWFVGDSFKTIYFIVNNSPLQFLFCGATQLVVDLAIYRNVWGAKIFWRPFVGRYYLARSARYFFLLCRIIFCLKRTTTYLVSNR